MSPSAVFKYMAKQAVDSRNMVVTVKGCDYVCILSTYFNVLYAYFIIGRKIRIIRVFYYWT